MNNIEKLQEIVKNKTADEVNGVTVDLFSASLVLSVLENLAKIENKEKFKSIINKDIEKAVKVAYCLHK